MLCDVLIASLQARYQKQSITSSEVMRATTRLCATPKGNLYEANRATHRLITDGFFLTREDSSLPDLYIRPIDWEDGKANAFCLVTQLEVQGMEFRRTDGVLYVNGLPLVVLEFKSTVREETTLAEAHRPVTVRYGHILPYYKLHSGCLSAPDTSTKHARRIQGKLVNRLRCITR